MGKGKGLGKGYTVTVVVEVETDKMATAVERFMKYDMARLVDTIPGTTAHVGDKVAVRTAETKLEHYVWLFRSHAIDKFEFYSATKHYSAQEVADASGIDLGVVQDRRHYLRHMA